MYLRPIITESSLDKVKNANEYTFAVEKSSTKFDIKKIVQEVFEVRVIDVRTKAFRIKSKKSNKGKIKLMFDKKQAIVKLDKKDKIELFEVKEEGNKK